MKGDYIYFLVFSSLQYDLLTNHDLILNHENIKIILFFNNMFDAKYTGPATY